MPQAQVRDYVGVGKKGVRMEKAQGGGLNRAAEVEREAFQRLRQVGNDHFPHVVSRGPVKHQAEGTFGVMLADEHHGALKKGAPQFAAVEQQLSFQESLHLRHSGSFRRRLTVPLAL